jgi:flagellar hook-associated protein 3 FlgL
MDAGLRVTQRMMVSQSLQGLEANQSRLSEVQRRMTSGRTISKPSDDPAGTASALRLRSELARSKQWSRNAQDGSAWLSTIDTTLQSMGEQVRRVRELVLQGVNGTMSAQSRGALATEVDGLRQSLLQAANTTYLGRPVFGGTTSGQRAYDPTTGAYLGDSGVVTREVGAQASVRVDVTGVEAFGPAGTDLFATLTQVAADLRTNPAGLSADLTALDTAAQRITTAQTDVGARANRIERATSVIDLRTDNLTTSLSEVEDIDMARTIYDLNVAQLSYQGALQATAKVIQPSLLDFLR